MKKMLNPMLALSAVVGAVVLTGCASNSGDTDVAGARSALAFTTVTDSKEMAKWTGDKYLQNSVRSIDTYFFQVPDTGFRPGGVTTSWNDAGRVNTEMGPAPMTTDSVSDFNHPEGVGAAGSYQSETGGSKVIEYRPGHSH